MIRVNYNCFCLPILCFSGLSPCFYYEWNLKSFLGMNQITPCFVFLGNWFLVIITPPTRIKKSFVSKMLLECSEKLADIFKLFLLHKLWVNPRVIGPKMLYCWHDMDLREYSTCPFFFSNWSKLFERGIIIKKNPNASRPILRPDALILALSKQFLSKLYSGGDPILWLHPL